MAALKTATFEAQARQVRRDLHAGRLTLGQSVGLTPAEVAAVMCLARRQHRCGRWARARTLYSLLLIHQPLDREIWRAMRRVQCRLGDRQAVDACDQALLLLEARGR